MALWLLSMGEDGKGKEKVGKATYLENIVFHIADFNRLAAMAVVFCFIGHQRLKPENGFNRFVY